MTNLPVQASSSGPSDSLAHLRPEPWRAATRAMVAKMIAEFSHERLLAPAAVGDGSYALVAEAPGRRYTFVARRWGLDHWEVDPDSIQRRQHEAGHEAGLDLDALEFALDFRETLGLAGDQLIAYLEELSATLEGDAYKRCNQREDAATLATADFQTVETAMTAGHPCFVANAARLGFDLDERRRFVPEAAVPMRYLWLAGRRDRAAFHAIEGIDYADFITEELGAQERARLEAELGARGLDPADYLLIPVHPWQWRNHLCTALAGDIARGELVALGEGEDRYQPQQSIRTAFNLSHPRRCYIKTALGIVNMGFVRGLSPYYMEATPAINQWVDELVRGDATLAECNFEILRELATVGYRSRSYERAGPRSSRLNKLVAALWRESPLRRAAEGEQFMTMAALLHLDLGGRSLLAELLSHHALDPEAWLRRYLHVYLRPVLHCYFAHELVFMPHGENLILGLRGGMPARALMKDIGEEALVFRPAHTMPEAVRRMAVDFPEDERSLHIFMDVFDCFFRFLAPIMADQCGLSEVVFWRAVAECVEQYQDDHPELGERFARDDLFAPRFMLSCINRLQLRNARQLLDLGDPASSLRFSDMVANPLADFRPPAATAAATPTAAAAAGNEERP
ncbi:IucA/IucC family siderophore biosynthesis protein [Pseudenhygromyxa sp. WMMC2535]|uniref:IucA/IucC family protein n=1 Tax=Pseudenhygromyxa sp. WMMC2535 TaxID=2712867 RepID=UPI0015567A81|nr:IucA/IucC family siderophore biosynthesis protein [Pseudenhygromyxa sp. WMMC2535]NVB36593.1 IucA/IucC family siderophore biosynthesis protein [Pseudenhygromyxa sp. WMMC2535]